MIRAAAGVLVRSLLELALVLFVLGALLMLLAGRTSRRFLVSPAPDRLERAAAYLEPLARLFAAGVARTRT